MRVVDAFSYQQVRSQQGNVGYERVVLQRFHAHFRTVGQNICTGQCVSKSLSIVEIDNGDHTVGILIDTFGEFLRFGKELILAVEEFDFFDAFNRCLGANGR